MKERHNINNNNNDDSSFFASCDWRLSRAAREILRVHLEHAWRQEIFDGRSDETLQFQHHDNLWQLLEESLTISTTTSISPQQKSAENHDAVHGNLHPHYAADDLCPLLPERDAMGRFLEETVVQRVDAGRLLFKKTRQSSLPGAMVRESKPRDILSSLYHCGLCDKNFTSRYYLDRHLLDKHGDHLEQVARDFHSSASTSRSTSVPPLLLQWCPAQDWCGQFLSQRDCHQAALELEPYYGPGSAGRSSVDRDAVQRQRIRESSSSSHHEDCTTAADRTLAACRAMIRHCFGGDTTSSTTTMATKSTNGDRNVEEHSWNRQRIGRHLNATLCVPQHSSCSAGHLLDALLSSSSSRRQQQHRRVVATMLHPADVPTDQTWQDVWHSEEEQLGVLVVLIFLGIVCFYGYRCLPPASSSTATTTNSSRSTDRSSVASNKESMRHSNPEDKGRRKQRLAHPRDLNLPPVDAPSTHVKQH